MEPVLPRLGNVGRRSLLRSEKWENDVKVEHLLPNVCRVGYAVEIIIVP